MSTYRAMLLTLAVLALSTGAAGVASLTAWARCEPGSDCSTELTLAAADAVLVAVIGSALLILLRARAGGRLLRTALLAVAVGVAALPIAALLMREIWSVLLFGFLLACLVALVVTADREPPTEATGPLPRREDEEAPPVSVAAADGQCPAQWQPAVDAAALSSVVEGALEATIRVRDLCADLARIGEVLLSRQAATSSRDPR